MIGQRFGPYEVVAKLGEGGMGEVYQARDTRLGREVALKVVLSSLVADPDRIGRFEREAQVLAALNHPNIAHLYGFEDGPPAFLVMELVGGPTLADLISNGGLPLDHVLSIGRQIAEALEAAHDQGVVHRDLKPANIKVRDDGTVKVLDFGLAKAVASDAAASAEMMNSPTLTARATQLGVILGTAAYMAPEQAKGKAVDRRADIWAFGIVMLEMLTGERPFNGDDVSDTLAAVLRQDVDWKALPAGTPARLRRLLERCLDRDPKTRLRDIGEARVELARISAGAQDASEAAPSSVAAAAPRASAARRAMPLMLGLVGGAIAASFAAWAYVHSLPVPPPQLARFAVVPPTSLAMSLSPVDRVLAISPDGTRLAYIGGSENQLIVRAIDQLDGTPIAGIKGARQPFFSPDGKWIGFFDGANGLKKVSITGGPAVPICTISSPPRGAMWGDDDVIVFATATATTGLLSVRSGGGDPKMLTKPDAAHGELQHLHPWVLPGGKGILFTISATATQVEGQRVAVLDVSSGKWKTLLPGASQPEFVAPDLLLYAAAGTLRAVRFDPVRLEVLSDPVPVLNEVAMVSTGATQYSVSKTGAIVYQPGGLNAAGTVRSLAWVDRKGHEEPIKAPPRAYYSLRLSPDGTRVALDIRDQQNDIWIWDFARETLTPITFTPTPDMYPVWTPDGRRIVYSSSPGSVPANLFSQAADGTGAPEPLIAADHVQYANSFSPDGKQLVIMVRAQSDALALLTMEPRQTAPLLTAPPAALRNAEVSPDGHWLAYESWETSPPQVYVRPFPDVNSGKWQISTIAGAKPVWGPGGREIFYETADSLQAVTIQTTPTFSRGNPVKMFDLTAMPGLLVARHFDTRDGQRFIVIRELPRSMNEGPLALQQMVVVLNWAEELRGKVK